MIAQEMTIDQVLAQIKTNSIGLINIGKKLRHLQPRTPTERMVLAEFNATITNLRQNLDSVSSFFNEVK
jgi:hypothetical protein